MHIPNNLSYKCFQEMKAKLSTLRCDTQLCMENNVDSKHMYEIEFDEQKEQPSFTINYDIICCNSFTDRLNNEMDLIHKKYENI